MHRLLVRCTENTNTPGTHGVSMQCLHQHVSPTTEYPKGERDTDSEVETKRQRKTEREAETERDREIQREIERKRDRGRDRETEALLDVRTGVSCPW